MTEEEAADTRWAMAVRTQELAGADPFGAGVAERIWRRLAGAGIAATAMTGLAALWTTQLLGAVLIGVAITYVVGLPASWLISRTPGAPVLRHLAAGAAAGALTAVGLSVSDGSWGYVGLYAMFAVPGGVAVAGVAAGTGLALPPRAVRPVAALGLLVAVVGLPLATWFELRSPGGL